MFPVSDRSQTIMDCLTMAAEKAGVEVFCGQNAAAIAPPAASTANCRGTHIVNRARILSRARRPARNSIRGRGFDEAWRTRRGRKRRHECLRPHPICGRPRLTAQRRPLGGRNGHATHDVHVCLPVGRELRESTVRIYRITSRVWPRTYTHRARPRPTSTLCRSSSSRCLACKCRTKR